MAPKPLLRTAPISEFGEVQFTEGDDHGQAGQDFTTVPGWSDLRFQRDLAMAEVLAGTREAKDVQALPVNVRWTRRTNVNGTNDGQKLMAANNRGYRNVNGHTAELGGDIGQAWLTDLPPGARLLPDGTILNAAGDCQLMVCSQQQAAKNAYRKQKAMLDLSEQAGMKSINGEALPQVGIKGADPYVSKG